MNKKEGLRAAGLLAICLIIIAGVLAISMNGRQAPSEGEFNVPQNMAGIEDIVKEDTPSPGIADNNQGDSVTNTEQSAVDTQTAISDQTSPNTDIEREPSVPTKAASSIDLGSMQNPIGSKIINMAFSYNTDPVYSTTLNEFRSDHAGVDIQASLGDEVSPAFDGVVSEVRDDDKLGIIVVISHGDNVYTEYANLDEVMVKSGEKVSTETVIGTVGNSARYESLQQPHLHFGLKINGQYKNPIDYMEL